MNGKQGIAGPSKPDGELEDCLGHLELATSMSQIFDAANLPTNILIYGDWGTGKSTFLDFLASELSETGHHSYHVVRFNPWEYETSPNLLVPLLKAIAVSLPNEVGGADDVRKIARACLRAALDIGVRTGSKLLSANLFQLKLSDFEAALANEDSILETFVDQVQECRIQFEKLADHVVNKLGLRALVVLLDDLDRCTPDNVVSLIEGVRLYLTQSPGTPVVFAWAMDRDIVSQAITTKYNVAGFAGADYLEKLFDFQTPVPRLSPDTVAQVIARLYERSKYKEGLVTLLGADPADTVAQALDIAPLRNPRTLNRIWSMLNVLGANSDHVVTAGKRAGLRPSGGESDVKNFANNLLLALVIAYRFRDWRFDVLHHRDTWPWFLSVSDGRVPDAQQELGKYRNLGIVLDRAISDVALNMDGERMELKIQETHLKDLLAHSELLLAHGF